ncbi:tol-pal system-associated acyl-CoA thioesterase [Neptunicella sp.]|uniref:tol-pal system-associated acyl-CoA thioesterase n=1 Tax=Neptunicella sp. TaxID=2125986 RepID=UPI003F6941D6
MHQFEIRVYYEDTDAGGIVYYANYLKFLERARTEWLRELGIEQDELLNRDLGFVVRRVAMDNHRPAKFNQLLRVESHITDLKHASLVFNQTIYNHNNELLVSAIVHVACVSLGLMRATAIPTNIKEELLRVC